MHIAEVATLARKGKRLAYSIGPPGHKHRWTSVMPLRERVGFCDCTVAALQYVDQSKPTGELSNANHRAIGCRTRDHISVRNLLCSGTWRRSWALLSRQSEVGRRPKIY